MDLGQLLAQPLEYLLLLDLHPAAPQRCDQQNLRQNGRAGSDRLLGDRDAGRL